jgi:hypothetical protein
VAVVEVMCPFPFHDDGEAGCVYLGCKQYKTALPARICAQCQVQMHVTGVPSCVLVEWGLKAARVVVLTADGEWWQAALRALSACWWYAQANKATPPYAEWANDTSSELAQLLALTKRGCAQYKTAMTGRGAIALQLAASLGPGAGSVFAR